jgi:Uma2 family endonuclease
VTSTASISLTEELSGKPRLSYEEFLALPTELHVEWVDGEVVLRPSVGILHNRTVRFLITLFGIYLRRRPEGELLFEPFQMRGRAGRAPDLMVLLAAHQSRLHGNFLDGPADLVIEVVSPSGFRRDYIEKRDEYEALGVPEYWIIDPDNHEVSLFVMDGHRYRLVNSDAGMLRSTVLQGFWVREEWLWEFPDEVETLQVILAG